jgi:hypothetical protein
MFKTFYTNYLHSKKGYALDTENDYLNKSEVFINQQLYMLDGSKSSFYNINSDNSVKPNSDLIDFFERVHNEK